MEAGTIASWAVKEGESFTAGQVIAEIETDKATMGFEAQDPGVIAKILVQAGREVGLAHVLPLDTHIIITFRILFNTSRFLWALQL